MNVQDVSIQHTRLEDIGLNMERTSEKHTVLVNKIDIESGVAVPKKGKILPTPRIFKAIEIIRNAGILFSSDLVGRLAYSAAIGNFSSEPNRAHEAIRFIAAENIFSENLRSMLNQYIATPISLGTAALASLFTGEVAEIKWGTAFGAALIEHAVFQIALQQGLFQKIPEAILGKISPEHKKFVHSRAAVVSRIAITAMLFALSHTNQWSPAAHGTVPQFMAGLLYSSITELKGLQGAASCVLAHTILNIFLRILEKTATG